MRTSVALLSVVALLSGGAMAGDNDERAQKKAGSFASLDADADGKISKDEASGNESLAASFDRLDSDSDGFVSKKEYRRNTMPKPKPASM